MTPIVATSIFTESNIPNVLSVDQSLLNYHCDRFPAKFAVEFNGIPCLFKLKFRDEDGATYMTRKGDMTIHALAD